MISSFPEILSQARTIQEVSNSVLGVLAQARREQPDQIIAYVAGAITADGPDKIAENSRLLATRASKVRRAHPLTFSAPDIFTPEVYNRIKGLSLDPGDYFQFFRVKLRSGLVDIVYMTPGWRRSSGSRDEYETANYLGIPVIDMESHPVWRWVDQG